MIGSNQPIEFEPSAIHSRLAGAQSHYLASGIDILALVAPYLDRSPQVFDPSYDRSVLDDVNTDLFPKDEWGVAAR